MKKRCLFELTIIGMAALAALMSGSASAGEANASLRVAVTEKGKTGPLPCRVYLTANGEPVYAPGCPKWERDLNFCCDGGFSVEVPAGKIELVIDRSPEWTPYTDQFDLKPGEARRLEVALSRWIDMNKRGWYSGDLHIHRPPAELPLLMRANDLNVGPDLTHWNANHAAGKPPYLHDASDGRPRFFHLLNQEDERFGGAILMFNLKNPILKQGVYRYWPAGMAYQDEALKQEGVHIEQEKPFWWEAPVNVALGRIDSIGVCHNHFNRRSLMENEAWGRPRDREQYPGPLGFCHYTMDLYYRYLNLGWNIPASAGSASGVLTNPVGYCRTYVQADGFDKDGGYEKWFEAFRAGRNFVTNGPMLFVTVNGRPIGTDFDVKKGQRFEATVSFQAMSRAPLDRLEIVVGGNVISTYRPKTDEPGLIEGETTLPIERSTWLAVRAFEKHKPTPRFAHTSPFYFTVGGEKRRDPAAARFFADWIDELIALAKKERGQFRSEENFNEVVEIYRKAGSQYRAMAEEK